MLVEEGTRRRATTTVRLVRRVGTRRTVAGLLTVARDLTVGTRRTVVRRTVAGCGVADGALRFVFLTCARLTGWRTCTVVAARRCAVMGSAKPTIRSAAVVRIGLAFSIVCRGSETGTH